MVVYRKKKPLAKYPLGKPPKYTDAQLHELGEQMIKAIEDNDDWTFLQDFATSIRMPASVLFELGTREAFAEYYELAKQIIGSRIVKRVNQPDGIHSSMAHRFLGCYFNDVKEIDKLFKGIATDYAANRIIETLQKKLDPSKNSVIKEKQNE